jgi:glycosyltransferase involved in cell wall biosynthesis
VGASQGHTYAIFSARYAPLTGGIESYTKGIATALVRRGRRVIVVTSQVGATPGRETDVDGVEVVRLPAHSLMGGRLPIPKRNARYRQVLAGHEREGIDRVLVNARFYGHSIEGLAFARRIGAPSCVLDHGSAYLVLGNPVADAALVAWEHVMTARCRRYRPRFAAVSTASAQWLSTFGIACDTVIPNALDAEAFRASDTGRDFRRELGVGADTTLVAFCGRLEPEKGSLLLAQAAALVDGREVAFALAGEGSERPAIEALGLAHVHLLGMLSHADLAALFRCADLFCLPTRSEGFCTSLIEAASMGLTPVMPVVGGVHEVMGVPADFGLILEDRNPATIARAISHAHQTGACGHDEALARRTAERCSWDHSAELLEGAFEAR